MQHYHKQGDFIKNKPFYDYFEEKIIFDETVEGFSYNDDKEAVYVKGEDLKKELEERGFILYQYESTTMVQQYREL